MLNAKISKNKVDIKLSHGQLNFTVMSIKSQNFVWTLTYSRNGVIVLGTSKLQGESALCIVYKMSAFISFYYLKLKVKYEVKKTEERFIPKFLKWKTDRSISFINYSNAC